MIPVAVAGAPGLAWVTAWCRTPAPTPSRYEGERNGDEVRHGGAGREQHQPERAHADQRGRYPEGAAPPPIGHNAQADPSKYPADRAGREEDSCRRLAHTGLVHGSCHREADECRGHRCADGEADGDHDERAERNVHPRGLGSSSCDPEVPR